MAALPILSWLGWVHLSVPPFYPVAAIAGGYVFGIAMGWAVGCAGGVWFKWGAGNWGAAVAVLGLALGASAAELGVLKDVREALQGVGASDDVRSATIGGWIGFDAIALIVAPIIVLVLFRTKIEAPTPKSWTWARTGAAMGLLGVAAWLLSHYAGRDFGLAVVPGSVDALNLLVRGETSRLSWDFFFVIFIPLGGWLAARKMDRPETELSRKDLVSLFVGGLAIGASAAIAGGCTVGHSLVGLPLLSVGSIVVTFAMILGTWTVGWFEMRQVKKSAS